MKRAMKKSLMACTLVWSALLIAKDGRAPLNQAPAKESARTNPYQGQPAAQKAGQKLYVRECSSCHGEHGEGSRAAPALAGSMESAQPGAIFWVLRNGSLWHGMPSFSHLPEAQRWQIVTYLKTKFRP